MKRLLKLSMVFISCYSLLIPAGLYAQSSGGTKLGQIQSLVSGATNQLIGAMGSRAQCGQYNSILAAMKPKVIPAVKYFPECPILESNSAKVGGLCTEEMSPDEAECIKNSVAPALEQYASSYDDYMFNKAQETGNATGAFRFHKAKGTQCLTDKLTETGNDIMAGIDLIQRQITTFNKHKQKYQEALKQQKAEIDLYNQVLTGKQVDSSLANDTPDFFEVLGGTACQSVLGATDLSAQNGLMGTQTKLRSPASAGGQPITSIASSFDQNKYKKQLEQQIDLMMTDIDQYGIDSFMKGDINSYNAGGTLATFSGVDSAFNDVSGPLKKELKDTSDFLKKYNYSLPEMDENFASNVSRITGEIKKKGKSRFAMTCAFNDTDQGGLGATLDSFFAGIRSNSVENREDYIQDITALHDDMIRKVSTGTLDDISDLDTFFDKWERLDKQYHITIRVNNNGGKRSSTSRGYKYFKNSLERCESKYDNFRSLDDGTPKEVDNKVINKLQKLSQNASRFKQNLTSRLRSQVINCSGNSELSGELCTANSFSPSTAGFCLKKATTCREKVTKCNSIINNQVKVYKAKRKTAAKKFDTLVNQFVGEQEALTQGLKSKFLDGHMKFLAAKFPDSTVTAPPNLFVPIETSAASGYADTPLLGGGNIEALMNNPENFEGQMNKLIEKLQEQKQYIETEVNEYIATKEARMQQEHQSMMDQYTQCEEQAKKALAMEAQMLADAEAQHQQSLATAGEACKRYYALRGVNAPICDGDNSAGSILNDLKQVAPYVDGGAMAGLYHMSAECDMRDSLEEAAESEEDELTLADICGNKLNKQKTDPSELASEIQDLFDDNKTAITASVNVNVSTDTGNEYSATEIGDFFDEPNKSGVYKTQAGKALYKMANAKDIFQNSDFSCRKLGHAIAESTSTNKEAKDLREDILDGEFGDLDTSADSSTGRETAATESSPTTSSDTPKLDELNSLTGQNCETSGDGNTLPEACSAPQTLIENAETEFKGELGIAKGKFEASCKLKDGLENGSVVGDFTFNDYESYAAYCRGNEISNSVNKSSICSFTGADTSYSPVSSQDCVQLYTDYTTARNKITSDMITAINAEAAEVAENEASGSDASQGDDEESEEEEVAEVDLEIEELTEEMYQAIQDYNDGKKTLKRMIASSSIGQHGSVLPPRCEAMSNSMMPPGWQGAPMGESLDSLIDSVLK